MPDPNAPSAITELLNAINEFFKSPLGVVIYGLVAAYGAVLAGRIINRRDTEKQLAKVKTDAQELAQEEKRSYLDLIDGVRDDWIKSQKKLDEQAAQAITLNGQLDAAKQALQEASRINNERDKENGTLKDELRRVTQDLNSQIDTLRGKVTTLEREGREERQRHADILQNERDKADVATKQETYWREHSQDVENRYTGKVNALTEQVKDLMDQVKDLGGQLELMQTERDDLRRQLKEVKDDTDELKGQTGKLTPPPELPK